MDKMRYLLIVILLLALGCEPDLPGTDWRPRIIAECKYLYSFGITTADTLILSKFTPPSTNYTCGYIFDTWRVTLMEEIKSHPPYVIYDTSKLERDSL